MNKFIIGLNVKLSGTRIKKWKLLEKIYKRIYNEVTAITKRKILGRSGFYDHKNNRKRLKGNRSN